MYHLNCLCSFCVAIIIFYFLVKVGHFILEDLTDISKPNINPLTGGKLLDNFYFALWLTQTV